MDFSELRKNTELVSNKFTPSGIGDIQSDLCSRQVVSLPLNDNEFQNILLSEFDRDRFNGLILDPKNIPDFSKMSDAEIDKTGVCVSEYNCSGNIFSITDEYMAFIKSHPELASILVKTYGAEFATDKMYNKLSEILNKNIKLPEVNEIIPPGDINYLTFKETKYEVINEDGDVWFILNINIPYSFYSKISFLDSTFAYDDITKKYYIEGNMVETEKIVDTILENNNYMSNPASFPGITMLVKHDNIIPLGREGTDIFVAKFLKLPYIPATLILSDGKMPFIMNYGKACKITTQEINALCNPYFIFPE